jgi:hypothetical protein
MGAKTPNGGLVPVVLYSPEMGDDPCRLIMVLSAQDECCLLL